MPRLGTKVINLRDVSAKPAAAARTAAKATSLAARAQATRVSAAFGRV